MQISRDGIAINSAVAAQNKAKKVSRVLRAEKWAVTDFKGEERAPSKLPVTIVSRTFLCGPLKEA